MTFKDYIETKRFIYGCPGLKNAKYINGLNFNLNLKVIYNKQKEYYYFKEFGKIYT